MLSQYETDILEAIKKELSQLTIESVTARSRTPFDLEIKGKKEVDGCEMGYTGWLPLLVIKEFVDWTEHGDMTDYPGMVSQGDWSGVRDSDPGKVFDLFLHHGLPRLTEMIPTQTSN